MTLDQRLDPSTTDTAAVINRHVPSFAVSKLGIVFALRLHECRRRNVLMWDTLLRLGDNKP